MTLPCTGAGAASASPPPPSGFWVELPSPPPPLSSPGGGWVTSVPESFPEELEPLSSPPQPAASAPAATTPPSRTDATPQRIKVNLRISTLLAQKDEDCESVYGPRSGFPSRSFPTVPGPEAD